MELKILSNEELELKEQKQREKYYPKKIANNIWRFYVHGFEKVEIYVFDEIPTIETLKLINLSGKALRRYVKHKNYQPDVDGRCKRFMFESRNIIIVSIHNLDKNIQNIVVASHEFNHCAHRILESEGNHKELIHYEESHCHVQDWLLETYLTITIAKSDFTDLYKSRDLLWFHVITHN